MKLRFSWGISEGCQTCAGTKLNTLLYQGFMDYFCAELSLHASAIEK